MLESNSPPSLAPMTDVTMFEETALNLRVVATDPDLPPQPLAFSLGPDAPTGATINATNGLLTWTPTEADGPGSFTFTITVSDNGEPPLVASRQLTVRVLETNSAPRLTPVPDQMAYVLTPLLVTNVATDPDPRGDRITFGLGPGAPAGSRIDPTNGLFLWCPSRVQAPSTNRVTVWAMDDGFEPLATTNTFTVVVTDYLEVELGEAMVRAGQTASVPVRVTSTAPAQVVDFDVGAPAELVSLVGATNFAPDVGWCLIEPAGADLWRIRLESVPGRALLGTNTVAQLQFLTASNQSARVPLVVPEVVALQSDGELMPKTLGTPGWLTLVAEQPLLLALLGTNAQRDLLIFGLPDVTFTLEQTFDLGGAWQPAYTNLTIPDLKRLLPNLPQTDRTIFYRLRQE